jgi:hypothetical protein
MAAVIQPETERRMSLYDLTQTPEFGKLSPKMATFLMRYVQDFISTGTFDPLAATKEAYPKCKSDETARIFGYQLLANPKIIAALDCFFGNSPERASLKVVTSKADQNRKRLLKQVEANLKAAEPGSVAAQRLLAQKERLLGLGVEVNEPEDGEPKVPAHRKFKVGDRFTQHGHTGRVVAVDADGQPTQVEEIFNVR